MIDFGLGRDHDLALGKDQDLTLIDGAESVRQQIEIMLLTFLGEWFLDTDVGIPYFERILIKSPDRAQIEAILRAKVIAIDGVDQVTELDIQYEAATRRAVITLNAHTTYGLVPVVAKQQPQGQ
jgi:hypothetical protein